MRYGKRKDADRSLYEYGTGQRLASWRVLVCDPCAQQPIGNGRSNLTADGGHGV